MEPRRSVGRLSFCVRFDWRYVFDRNSRFAAPFDQKLSNEGEKLEKCGG